MSCLIRRILPLAWAPLLACAQPVENLGGADPFDARDHYIKSDYMIPMRDGVELYTIVYAPRETSRAFPILLFRTPYSVAPYGADEYREPLGPNEQFDRDGYIFVFQDVRGRYRSEGDFVLIRPHIADKRGPQEVDESSDTFDTIEWLLDNIPNHNGRVGQWGISYPGYQTVMGMIDAHPALKASSPQGSPSDMFIGDDWYHNGAFRIMYAFGWLSRNARARAGPTEERPAPFEYGTPWGYRFFLEAGSSQGLDDLYFNGEIAAWNELMQHWTYDEYWRSRNVLPHLEKVDHAVLNVAGWFDAEDFYGPMSIYYSIEEKNPENQSTLVVGPWRHGGWNRDDGDVLGCIDFGSETSRFYQDEMLVPFFRSHLHGNGSWRAPEAVVFETGANEWRAHDQWPPAGAVPTHLYFHENGRLSFSPPTESADRAVDAYVSDPAKPVPFSAEIVTRQGHEWMVEDQRFASTRPDVLVYRTDVLTEDVTIAGPILANLWVSTTGTDSDWVVKLIDVHPGDAPEGHCSTPMGDFQMLLAGEIMRGKFRNSFDVPEPMVPDRITEVRFDLRDRYHTFRKGHRMMVQIQSTWFPTYDRNPQTFLDIHRARPADFQVATQRVYRAREYPSHLTLGVLR